MSIRRVIRGIALEFFAKSLFFDTQTCELHSFFYEKKKTVEGAGCVGSGDSS